LRPYQTLISFILSFDCWHVHSNNLNFILSGGENDGRSIFFIGWNETDKKEETTVSNLSMEAGRQERDGEGDGERKEVVALGSARWAYGWSA
jgi:hypothetical protein